MAVPVQQQRTQNAFRLSPESILLLQDYAKAILEHHNKNKKNLHDKLEYIDVSYARYKSAEKAAIQSGLPLDASGTDISTEANQIYVGITEPELTVPIVISQVDSFVGYFTDVFLSGYPMFPVVSEPKDQKEAEMLEAILDTTTVVGRYPRHMLMSFRDAAKYNFMPYEIDWCPLEQYDIVSNYLQPQAAARMQQKTQHYTKYKRLDPYNTILDDRVDPVDVAAQGEYSGYVELIPRLELKRLINRNTTSGELYNVKEISDMSKATGFVHTDLPTINEYLNNTKGNRQLGFDWDAYLTARPARNNRSKHLRAGIYEKTVLYVRIIPVDFQIYNVPKPKSPMIWKLTLVNGTHIIHAKPIFTIYDNLPVGVCQPLEDGFGIQTQSLGEAQIPYQEAASTLLNIRMNSARRAISDRALYDPTLVSSSDVNARVPAAKIPVRMSGLNDKGLERAYKDIPFNHQGTESVIGDMTNIMTLSDRQSGLNAPQQGRFQKGNKSVQEWQDTMAFADNRARLPALTIEFQMMVTLKETMRHNIFQYGVVGAFQSFKTGQVYDIKPEDLENLKTKILSLRIADGFTPKSKMASTEVIMSGLETISQNQILAQTYGQALPQIFSHLMQLGGVRGLDQYLPKPVDANGQLIQQQQGQLNGQLQPPIA